MPDEKEKIKIHCPKCHELNLVWRSDFRDKEQIAFKCAKCGEEICLENPDFSPEAKKHT